LYRGQAEPFREGAAEYGTVEAQKGGLEGEGSGRSVSLKEPISLDLAVAMVRPSADTSEQPCERRK